MDEAERVASAVRAARCLVALTGAGISTSAGIPDFRGPRGLYVTRSYPESVFDIEAFVDDPRAFFRFARDFIALSAAIRPTLTHTFLARLEQRKRLAGVVTQNIDGLHQRAGSRKVIEVHGGFDRWTCLRCAQRPDRREAEAQVAAGVVPRCAHCGGPVKPDIVFFGEAVQGMDQAEELVRQSDLLLVLGSSLTVFPVAGLPTIAGGRVIVVARGPVSAPHGALLVDADVDGLFRRVQALLGDPPPEG